MHRLFGKKKETGPAPTLSEAAVGLNQRQEDLDKKIKQLDAELIRYKNQMKTAKGSSLQSLRRRATEVLKRKNVYLKQRDMTSNQLFNVDQTAFQIENIKGTQTMVAAMKEGASTLKKETGKIDIDELETMQGDLEDMFEDMEEVHDILGQSYATNDFIGDDDLDAELAGLEDDLEVEDYSLPSYLQPLPEAPSTTVPADNVFNNATAQATTTETTGQIAETDAYGLPP